MSESTARHRHAAQGYTASCGVLTISDTRTSENDLGGDTMVEILTKAGHHIAARSLVRDEPALIASQLTSWLEEPEIQVILTTGGTGISSRDTTIEVVQRWLTKEITGFGELFRMLSFEEIGAAAMLSRAVAGLSSNGTILFSMPGAPPAVELAMNRLIIPELPHLLWERQR